MECPNEYVNVNNICILSKFDQNNCKKCSQNKLDCSSCLVGYHLMKNHSCKKCDENEEFYNLYEFKCERCDRARIGCNGPSNKDCKKGSYARSNIRKEECLIECGKYEHKYE